MRQGPTQLLEFRGAHLLRERKRGKKDQQQHRITANIAGVSCSLGSNHSGKAFKVFFAWKDFLDRASNNCFTLLYPIQLSELATITQFEEERNQNWMDRIIGHYLTATMKIIKSIGFLRMDIGHMLLFGVIAMTFLREGLDIWVGWIFPPCNMASQIQGAVY